MPKSELVDHKKLLEELKFVKVYSANNEIWLNSRYIDLYRKTPERFGCHSVYDSVVDPKLLIKAYKEGVK